ncbi:class IV adenylate cyclase [Yinghuangia soli]|uniref:CYTH domain-containing protein n=1 Tax=Yinghuangia soli TaxID=2908204 RepID=A0AA41U1W9_9ACTN|nr:CYTH domain-containing protein [Yinghuangia soli]MCF2526514.1 CYTH domain-containing protein [Yinghuangia soli]
MIEAELKARVRDPEDVMSRLEGHGPGRAEVYQDTYFDDASGTLMREDRELRVRTVHGADGTRSVLTYKGARLDASGSKPEHETAVDDPDSMRAVLLGLGYVVAISFEKRCRNYVFDASGRRMLATLVRVKELDETFVEVETLVGHEAELSGALDDVRTVLADLGIAEHDLTSELYTDAVQARRVGRATR